MLLRLSLLIITTNISDYCLLIRHRHLSSSAAIAAARSNFPAISRMEMNRGSNSFPSLAQSYRSGGRGRGQSEMGGNHQGSRGGGLLVFPASSSVDGVDACSSIPATSSREMHRGSSSFSSLAQSSRSSGGRGRGQSEMGGNHQGSRGGGLLLFPASSSVDTVAACSSIPATSSREMHRGSSSFPSLAQSSRSGGRGRGRAEIGGNSQGSRGGGRGAAAGGTSNRIDALGRILVRILRHMATELNLDMRSDGYVRVQDLLQLNLKSRANIPLRSHTIDEIREAVRTDNKQRLGLLEENGQLFIRANQGHSVEVVETESLLRPITSAEDIPVCVHGTYKKFRESILQSGLKRMSRLHVHFSSGLPSDDEVISGMRRDINMLIFLDVKKALEDGMKLYMSENKVILTEGFDGVVPAKYFQKIELWPSRKPLDIAFSDLKL